MTGNNIKIITDFDETLTTIDVLDTMFIILYGSEGKEIIEKSRKGAFAARTVHEMLCENKDFTQEFVTSFIKNVKITEGIKELNDYCKKNQIEIIIMSDGFDIYIKEILVLYNLDEMRFYSNKITVKDKSYKISYPYAHQECMLCGHCKKNTLEAVRNKGDFIIYIGDSTSDYCPAGDANMVFAKGTLESYCQQENIPYKRFENYFDVINYLKGDCK